MDARILPTSPDHRELERACVAHLSRSVSFAISDWVLRVANLPAFRADPGLDLGRLRGEIAPLLDAIIASIAVSDRYFDEDARSRIVAAATLHGGQRRAMDVPIGTLITEIQELRRVVQRTMVAWSEADAGSPALPTMSSRLERAVELAMVATAEGWASPPVEPNRSRHA